MTDNVHLLGSQKLRQQVKERMESRELSQSAAARSIGKGVSAGTLSQWLSGKYAGDIPAVELRISQWLDREREGDQRRRQIASVDEHRALRVTDNIRMALTHAQSLHDIVVITGVSGAGKSWACEYYCESRPNSWYLPMNRCVRSSKALLGRVARATGMKERYATADDLQDKLCDHLHGRSALLVIDEAHHLPGGLIDDLRLVRDQAKCGLALVGNLGIDLSRLPQVKGRVGVEQHLGIPEEDDIARLLAGVLGRRASTRERRLALKAASKPGGLHALRRALGQACRMAWEPGRDGSITADILAFLIDGEPMQPEVVEPEADEAMEATA